VVWVTITRKGGLVKKAFSGISRFSAGKRVAARVGATSADT
jgi:hypothetical protein